MKIAILVGILVFLGMRQFTFARPFGNSFNVAVSEDFSNTQSASDRKENEWSSSDIWKQFAHDFTHDKDPARAHDITRLLIYANGNAPNVTNPYQSVKFQSSDNYGTSDYNGESFGIKVDFEPHDYK